MSRQAKPSKVQDFHNLAKAEQAYTRLLLCHTAHESQHLAHPLVIKNTGQTTDFEQTGSQAKCKTVTIWPRPSKRLHAIFNHTPTGRFVAAL